MEKRKKLGVNLISGALLLLLGLFYDLAMEVHVVITVIFVFAGIAIIVASVLKYTVYGEASHDERTRKLGSRALSYSWFLTFLVLVGIFWLDYFEVIELTVQQTITVMILVMTLSAGILQWTYRKKGDIY